MLNHYLIVKHFIQTAIVYKKNQTDCNFFLIFFLFFYTFAPEYYLKYMKQPVLTLLSVIFIFAIVGFQAFIIHNIYLAEKKSLKDKLDVILDLTYKKDLDDRIRPSEDEKSKPIEYSVELFDENDIVPENTVRYNLDSMNIDENDIISLAYISMSEYANEKSPLDILVLAEIALEFLTRESVFSNFVIQVVDDTGHVLQTSQLDITNQSSFVIPSKEIPLNFFQTERLRILLINPQQTIFKQISLVILSCLLFLLVCVYYIWKLQRIFAKQRKATEIKNELFGHISHELKRPVSQIIMATESLKKNKNIQDEAKRNKLLNILQEAGSNTSQKINMILALSMEEEGVFRLIPSEFDLLEVLENLVRNYQLSTQKTVEIRIENTSKNTKVKADREHITQCVQNLLENAIKYSNNPVDIQISLFDENSFIVISCKDNGLGIQESDLNLIFDKYNRIESHRGRKPGFGIGLHYVKKIIEKHSGKVEVRSVLDKGSEFLLYLPK